MATTVDPQPPAFKPKKSVALSGTPAGNTALCTVGRTGNDLHYRGYDIADLAAHCEFEEVAYLLLRGKLPNAVELAAYKQKLMRLRGLPANVCTVLEQLALRPPIPWMCCVPASPRWAAPCRKKMTTTSGGRDRVRRYPAGYRRVDAALLVPLQPQRTQHRRGDRSGDTWPATFLICCTASRPASSGFAPCRSRWCSMPSMSSTPLPLPPA